MAAVAWQRRKPAQLCGFAIVTAWCAISALMFRPYAVPLGVAPTGVCDERAYYVDATHRAHPILLEDYAESLAAAFGRHAQQVVGTGLLCILDMGSVLEGKETACYKARTLPNGVTGVVTSGWLGVVGYLAGPALHVVDTLGLSDPIASRMLLEKRGRPGHEKHFPAGWAIARFASPDLVLDPKTAAARRVLSSEPVASLLRAVEEPLTLERFLANIVLSWRLHSLRIAPDPEVAERAFQPK